MPFTESDRLRALPPYLFVDIDRRKRALLAAGKDVINFGVGDPDLPTPDFIRQRMHAALGNTAYDRYPHDQGLPEFRRAVAAFFQRRYGVALDPDRELHVLIGSKEGVGHLPLAVVNPGRTVLVPDPGYPVYRAATIFAGGKPFPMPLREDRDWLPDLEAIPRDAAESAALMYINYPNNPTGATATLGFYERVVAFAKRYDLIVASDAAYNEMYFTEERPPSLLQVAGAKDVGVELHSLSKTFNMTGWRLGFLAGHAAVVAALARIKANLDSGQFSAIQEAGIAAYEGIDSPEVRRARETYRERAGVLCSGLSELGFRVRPPKATFYIWAGVPRGYDSRGVVTKLLEEAAVVCVPGTGFGAGGEGYVRFALTVDVERTRTAVRRMRELKW